MVLCLSKMASIIIFQPEMLRYVELRLLYYLFELIKFWLIIPLNKISVMSGLLTEEGRKKRRRIADFIGLPYFSGFPSGLKSHVLISHDFLSQSKFVPLPADRDAMCSRPASKHQKKNCFVCKQAGIYCIRSED